MRNPTRRFLIVMTLFGLWLGGAAQSGGTGELILDLDTLTADMDGRTLHATEVTDAYVGPIDEEVFVAIFVDEAAESDNTRSVRGYVCNREVGVWLDGEVDGDQVVLASSDEAVRIEATIAAEDVFGVARFGEVAPQPFTARAATGDAGLYRAEAQLAGDDRVAGWVVLADGRQRGSLDGKGNDVYPPPALR